MNKCLNCNRAVKNKYCSISCQNIHQGSIRADKKYGEYKIFNVCCNRCKNSLEVKERGKLFPQKDVYYCSASCANTRVHSNETKNKISTTLKYISIGHREIDKEKTCKLCKTIYHSRIKMSQFCSRSCKSSFLMINGLASIMGKKSVLSQGDKRRSKNEIYFAELCKEKFTILENQLFFNGWDADIIIPELKLAILWNGKWHYEKITKEHSIKQVQNRDRIKLEEIERAGYKSYVIKDMGKFKKTFVEEKFQEMLVYLKLI